MQIKHTPEQQKLWWQVTGNTPVTGEGPACRRSLLKSEALVLGVSVHEPNEPAYREQRRQAEEQLAKSAQHAQGGKGQHSAQPTAGTTSTAQESHATDYVCLGGRGLS